MKMSTVIVIAVGALLTWYAVKSGLFQTGTPANRTANPNGGQQTAVNQSDFTFWAGLAGGVLSKLPIFAKSTSETL